MSLFSKPDERTRQLRERAGATAMGTIFFMAMLCTCYFLFANGNNREGGIIFLWYIIGGSSASLFRLKTPITPIIREELNRNENARRKSIKGLLAYMVINAVTLYFVHYYFISKNSTQHETTGEIILQVVLVNLILGVYWYWRNMRRTHKKEEKHGDI